jgi:hypothetical protein
LQVENKLASELSAAQDEAEELKGTKMELFLKVNA